VLLRQDVLVTGAQNEAHGMYEVVGEYNSIRGYWCTASFNITISDLIIMPIWVNCMQVKG